MAIFSLRPNMVDEIFLVIFVLCFSCLVSNAAENTHLLDSVFGSIYVMNDDERKRENPETEIFLSCYDILLCHGCIHFIQWLFMNRFFCGKFKHKKLFLHPQVIEWVKCFPRKSIKHWRLKSRIWVELIRQQEPLTAHEITSTMKPSW